MLCSKQSLLKYLVSYSQSRKHIKINFFYSKTGSDNKMTTLDNVYRKFGQASEAAQLLEVELVNVCLDYGFKSGQCVDDMRKEFDLIDRFTLEKLIKRLKSLGVINEENCVLIEKAKEARNDLSHNFYRRHGFRRLSEEGCQIMLENLEELHWKIFEGYRHVLLLSNIDIPRLSDSHEEYKRFENQ